MITDTPVRERFAGRAVLLAEDGVDTDRILPSRFLAELDFRRLGRHVFAGDRANAAARGRVHPFDEPELAHARILVTGDGFGTGSSREAAPQALTRWGIDVIVAVGFGEIFRGNAAAIGLPCPTIARQDFERLAERMRTDPLAELSVSLAEMTVTHGGLHLPIELNEHQRAMFRSGRWDTLSLLLEGAGLAAEVAARLPYLTGWRR